MIDKKMLPLESCPLNGYRCSVCGQVQYDTPSGDVCINGHGGADPLGMNEVPIEPTKNVGRLYAIVREYKDGTMEFYLSMDGIPVVYQAKEAAQDHADNIMSHDTATFHVIEYCVV